MGQPPACEEGTAVPVTFHERGAISPARGGGWEEEFGSREIWADASPAGAGGGQVGAPGSREVPETRVCS